MAKMIILKNTGFNESLEVIFTGESCEVKDKIKEIKKEIADKVKQEGKNIFIHEDLIKQEFECYYISKVRRKTKGG